MFSRLLCLLILFVTSSIAAGQASAARLVGPELQNVTLFSSTGVTIGANSHVSGSVLSGVGVTVGANGSIRGDLQSVDAATIGAGSIITGGVMSSAGVTVGAISSLSGSITSGGATTIGAGAIVGGSVLSGAAVTTGDSATIAGSVRSGAAITIAANSTVGTFAAGVGAITVGANGTVPVQQRLSASPINAADFRTTMMTTTGYAAAEASAAKMALANIGAGTQIPANLTVDTTFTPGLYSASALTTTAGTTITFDGQGNADQYWIINIANSLTTGANTKIIVINAPGSIDIFWNVGGFSSLGATSKFAGNIIANSYVSIGANIVVDGLNAHCSSIASITSYITLGANSTVGGANCLGTSNNFAIDTDGDAVRDGGGVVPEPAAWVMMIAGFAMIGFAMRRRSNVPTA